jgi:quinol monooxygenase YgiN
MHATVAVIGSVRFAPEKISEILPHLRTLVEATRQHDGCIAYDVALDPFDAGLIRFSELWPDHASLAKHLTAPHIAPWRAAVAATGPLARSFTIYDVSGAKPL